MPATLRDATVVLNEIVGNEIRTAGQPEFHPEILVRLAGTVQKITEYIAQNFDEAIRLNDIAFFANMSVATFYKFFKQNYRVTFVECLNAVRIGHVYKRLGKATEPVLQMAYQCGFNNIANFNRHSKNIKS